MTPNSLTWEEIALGQGRSEWIVHVNTGAGSKEIARGATEAEALEEAIRKLGYTVLDRADSLPGKIAHFASCGDFVRNVAVLRTGLSSLYEEVKGLEASLPQGIHDRQDFDVNGDFAMLASKFDWFSISMLNLMDGVSLLDTLAQQGGDYAELVSATEGMELIECRAREYRDSIAEAGPLRQWRNKVAAHRSGIMPPRSRDSDSLQTQLISLMGAQVMARNGRYIAPALKPGPAGVPTSAPELQEWSLTETWESLASQRYPWLNHGEFFKAVSSLHLGEGRSLHSFELASGDAAVEAIMKKHGLELPAE
ncbi:MAG: hypothetical protein OYH76_13275 [Defluviicoccus sp.]|nr:hypothetical protein [Defluviicoccus sp.]MDE0276860.1 hypothetical protein [Defluviicoccus sp.]